MRSFNPRRVMTLVAIIASGLASLLACSDSEAPPSPFPNEVGSRWVYAAYDSLAAKADTVTVEIVGKTTTTILGETHPAAVWLTTSSKGEEWQYVTTNGDTVRIWGVIDGEVQFLDFLYVFPLSVGAEWKTPPCGMTAMVAQEYPVQVPGGVEHAAYLVTLHGFCLNVIYDEDREFVPGVGLTSAHWFWADFAWRNETWNLIEFELPGPS